ncbi:MAG: MBL fold metallo-hydrolase [Anaerolineae bacterium]|nr:MBL fold metallo-hydrolase [Anaerolineae bacterium]
MIVGLPIGLLQSNCYLVYDKESKDAAIVDPGFTEMTPILSEIQDRRLKINYVLNTHAHFDHIAGNMAMTKTFNVPLGLHPQDYDNLIEGGGADWFHIAYTPSPDPTLALTDGQVLALGSLNLQILHTPGHTPGSICLYIPEEKSLITGDTLFAGSVGRTDLPGGEAQALSQSLKRLLTLPPETTIYPGHGPTSTLAEEKSHNPWLKWINNRP